MHTYPLALNIISACWTLFAVIWLLAAFWTKRSVYQESRAQRLRYTIPILVGGFLLAKGHRLSDQLDHRVIPHVEALAWIGVVLCVAGLADRKSTRLNSSHLVISYAVFCLKKKKTIITHSFCRSQKKNKKN